MSESLLRIYSPDEMLGDGYPPAWNPGVVLDGGSRVRIPDYVRGLMDHRCERCGHPYPPGIAKAHPRGEWTPCDETCTHRGPVRDNPDVNQMLGDHMVEAQWRILTVHHLNGVKWDCRWWNLAALCQRCHLHIQKKVVMERVFPFEHSEWFKPHAAGWYADAYLDEDLTREETLARLDELLALEQVA